MGGSKRMREAPTASDPPPCSPKRRTASLQSRILRISQTVVLTIRIMVDNSGLKGTNSS